MSPDDSLDYILHAVATSSAYNQLLQQEVASLQHIVKDILVDIRGRKSLEDHLLSTLEKQVMRVHSGLMNVRSAYTQSLDVVIGLEHDLELLSVQKVRTQETTARDLIELKKVLWTYLRLLKEKEAQLLVLR